MGVLLWAGVLTGVGQRPALADVSAVSGGAFGFRTDVSLFGGPSTTRGPAPSVTLPSTGGSITDSDPSGNATYGPAPLFVSGELTVTTQGEIGPGGSSSSSATAADVGPNPLTAAELTSTCTSDESGSTGSTSIVGGQLNRGGQAGTVALPPNPAPNTQFEGEIADVGDRFRIVFNEQVVASGSITVNAAHMYLLGPTAVGDMIVGQSRCGVTAGPNDPNDPNDPADPTSGPGTGDGEGGGGDAARRGGTRRGADLPRTGADDDLLVAWAAMALTLGSLLLMAASALPGAGAPSPARRSREDDVRRVHHLR